MIILHRYRLIFIKTRKTAGTSIEQYLAQFAEAGDIVTPIQPAIPGHKPQNDKGAFNPLADSRISGASMTSLRTLVSILRQRQRFFNHMTAADIQQRVPPEVWSNYLKVAVERNPWDKVVSMYNMLTHDCGLNVTLDDVIDRELKPNWPIYAKPDTGTILVDRVLRYEALSDGLAEVFAEVGIPFSGELAVFAKSGKGGKRPIVELNVGQSRRIESRFADEIAHLGYSASIANVQIVDNGTAARS